MAAITPTDEPPAPTTPPTDAPKKARDIMGIDLRRIEKQAQTAAAIPITRKKPASKDEPTPTLTAGQYNTQTKFGFEQVQNRQYLTNTNQLVQSIETTDENNQPIRYIPLEQSEISWLLCTQTPAVFNKTQLWTDIKAYLYEYLELPEETQYDVLTAWVFANWIPELWNTVPYLFFFGAKNTGKTQALAILQYISYRANFNVCCTPAVLFRSIEKDNIIPFLDEAEVFKKETADDILACLNAGYKRVSGVIRRFQGDTKTGAIVGFRVFGFKAIAGTAKLKNTLESRCITVHMMQNTRDISQFIDDNQTQTIRDQLLQWRFWALQNLKIPRTKTEFLQSLPPEFKEMRNKRVVELFLPLYFVSDQEVKPLIVEYAQTVCGDQADEEATSIYAEIISAMCNRRGLVKNGMLELKEILNEVNQNRGPAEQISSTKKIGDIVESLAFQKKPCGHNRLVGVVWDEKKLERLKLRYLPPPPPQTEEETQETQPAAENKPQFPPNDQIAACTVLPILPDEHGNFRKFKWLCKRCGQVTDLLYHTQFFNKKTPEADVCNPCASQILEYLQQKEENRYE